MMSNNRQMVERDWRFRTKPIWKVATNLGNTKFKCVAKILANIFESVFWFDKGVYDEGISGSLCSLGITLIVTRSIDLGNFLSWNGLSNIFVNTSEKIDLKV